MFNRLIGGRLQTAAVTAVEHVKTAADENFFWAHKESLAGWECHLTRKTKFAGGGAAAQARELRNAGLFQWRGKKSQKPGALANKKARAVNAPEE